MAPSLETKGDGMGARAVLIILSLTGLLAVAFLAWGPLLATSREEALASGPDPISFLAVDPAVLLNGEHYSYCGGNPLAAPDSAGLAWYHVFVPWSDKNPIRIDAYSGGGMSKVTDGSQPRLSRNERLLQRGPGVA
jgi:hypothetical protein